MTGKTFYITTPIYYVNDVPHIGHAYTTVACDAISRYKRLCGFDVCFLTGTDEHGQKIEQAADKRGIKPKELADQVVQRFAGLWETLNISNDKFIRTTDELHKKAVRKIFNKMKENGDIYIDHYEGWYCTPCETYLTETQLLDGNCCPSCRRETSKLKEPSYFFRMSKYGDALLKHIQDNKDFIKPESRRNEIISFIKDGLRDLSVSRVTFKWGIPVPDDEEHVIYVWIDALTNYISALGYGEDDEDFTKFWPADYHVVGKDILRFHTVYWPTMLLSAGIELPKSVFAHGWWTVEGQKMSKSLGNAIDPTWLVEKFGVDAIRYFLLREVPFGLDGDFSFKALIHRINGDLANDLGNLLNRTMGMVNRYFDGTVPAYSEAGAEDKTIEETAERVFKDVDEHITNMAFNKALASMWEFVSSLNKYIDETAPWALAKDEAKKERLGSVLYTVLDGIRMVSLLLYPFMPTTAEKIREQLGTGKELVKTSTQDLRKIRTLESGHKLGEAEQLFPRIDEKDMLEFLKQEIDSEKKDDEGQPVVEEIDFSHFEKMTLKAVKVLECEKIDKSDKLLKLQIDMGSEKRQVVSGIAKSYKPEELVGKTLVLVANLKPAKLMGTLSEGMILSATSDGKNHRVLELPDSVEPGTDIK
ncbi:MAG: methionine--tRNA ligase [Denitrovibrio sp.]|mgnify:CR=1 FL=1|nr:MAG: methionine--tRNA ligase [Denitrovibrio sp.]